MAEPTRAGSFIKESLADVIDPTVETLRRTNPPWIAAYGADGLPAHVASLIHQGAAEARKTAKNGEDGFYSTGGVRVVYDPVALSTDVWVLMGTVYDQGTTDGDE